MHHIYILYILILVCALYIYIVYSLGVYAYTFTRISITSVVPRAHMGLQPIAFGVSFNLNLQSQSSWSLFNGTWEKRPRALEYRLRFENEEMALQMQYAGYYMYTILICTLYVYYIFAWSVCICIYTY